MWEAYGTRSSVKAVQAGVPDFFVYKCVDTFLFQHDLELQYVEGDGNCLTNSVIAQLAMETDPGAKELYTQIYLRRSVIRHLIANWNVLGEEITEDIRMLYGRPDSELNGKPLLKRKSKGKNRMDEYGFTVKEWCEFMIKDKSWCDAIFIKLIASMWGCKISVLRADNLNVVTYRYEGDFKDAEIRLLYNGNPTKGHYSPIGECEKNLNYTSNDINAVVFTRNYRKRIDLDERLKRCDSIWNLDNEKKIFTKKRGYNFVEEDKEEERADSNKKHDGEKGKMLLEDDEMVVKKKEFNEMTKKIRDLEKRVEELEKDEETEGQKRVIMHDGEMLIKTEHYNSLNKRCLDLEKEVEELKGGEGMVIVEDKNIKALEGEVEHVRKNLSLLAQGKELEVEPTARPTPRKRRSSQGDEPPSKLVSKMVAQKTPDVEKDMPEEQPTYEKDDTVCKICDIDQESHERLIKHNQKYHENKSYFTCNDCGKGFITSDGYRRHMEGHSLSKRLKCTFPDCTKTFTSTLTRKAHFKNVHMVKGPRIPCKFKDEGCTKDFSTKGIMQEHSFKCTKNPDVKELKCDLCGMGGFYMPKRVLQHKRKCHGWD